MNWHAENDDSSALELRQVDVINVCFSKITLKCLMSFWTSTNWETNICTPLRMLPNKPNSPKYSTMSVFFTDSSCSTVTIAKRTAPPKHNMSPINWFWPKSSKFLQALIWRFVRYGCGGHCCHIRCSPTNSYVGNVMTVFRLFCNVVL